MENEDEKFNIIFSYYLDWMKNAKKPLSINDLSRDSGLSRQTLSTLLSQDKFKMPKQKTIAALARVWGDKFYEDMGFKKPEIDGKYVAKVWEKLPVDVKQKIIDLVAPY